MLIRIETDGGHGGGTTTDQWIEEVADIYSFALFNMGIKPIY
jgi:prolyl oligopeptidase